MLSSEEEEEGNDDGGRAKRTSQNCSSRVDDSCPGNSEKVQVSPASFSKAGVSDLRLCSLTRPQKMINRKKIEYKHFSLYLFYFSLCAG